ncbi:MAG: hypothetical protein M5U12_08110 [Verrucomicrobia bacterium]|nr:hypothetical protein [Verrucomicrobiota bacterium]
MLPGGLAAFATLAWNGVGLPAEIRSSAVLSSEYLYRQYQREDGLPDNQIRAMLASRSGYLWVATRFGLARFDGTQFAVFNHLNTPELGTGDCHALAEDSAGNLWFICDQRLFRMAEGRPVRATSETVVQGITPGSLWADRLGRIWAGYASHLTVCLPDGGRGGSPWVRAFRTC